MDPDSIYAQLQAVLDLASLEITPSEVHGTVVGAIANHLKSGSAPNLLALIEPQADAKDSRFSNLLSVISELYRDTSDALFDNAEAFELVLPSSESELELRTEELAHWCKGYLLGLLHNEAFSLDQLGAQGSEIARDFMQIAEVEAGSATEREEDWALAELHEYVKVGAQLIFEEIYASKAAPAPDAVH